MNQSKLISLPGLLAGRKITQGYGIVLMALVLLVISSPGDLLRAQQPFAKRIGVSAFLGHNKLAGEMDKYLQGDLFAAVRVKYNVSQRIAAELTFSSGKRYIGRLEVPPIPFLEGVTGIDEVNLNSKFTPIFLNVNYYFSEWDTRPYCTLGFGYYNVSSDIYVSFDDPLTDPPFLLESTERMSGMNAGVGMETFLKEYLAFEIRASLHFLFYDAPAESASFKFPIDSPKYVSFGLGFTYYFN